MNPVRKRFAAEVGSDTAVDRDGGQIGFRNKNPHAIIVAACGFDKKIWSYTCREDSVEFTTVLADGEEGFPGRMEVAITFTLDDENGLHIDYRAVSDRDTVANFTNHAYFNLNGHGSGVHDPLLKPFGGYDNNFFFADYDGTLRHQATLSDPHSGRTMKMYTDQPCVQVYTANMVNLDDHPFKGNIPQYTHCGVCLETQAMPDSIHFRRSPM